MEENLYTSNSKKKFNFIYIKAILFVILLVPVIKFLGDKYVVASTENLINTYNEKRWEEFYLLPKNSLDIVFLGSSHSYCTFDPEVFDTELGTSSFQMGMPLQHLDTSYYTLLEVLNYQKPQLVVLEVYWDMLDDEFELTQAGYLFQVMKNATLENEYVNEVFPIGEKVKYNVKAFRYQADYFAYRNNELKKNLEADYGVTMPEKERQVGVEQYRSKGYTYCNYNMLADEFDKTNQFKDLDGKKWSADSAQVKYLNKIISTCKANNIEIVLVTAPIANVSMDYIKNYAEIHNFVEGIANENGITYIDYNIKNKEQNMLVHDNFRDDAHLNDSGVQIVSGDLAKWLSTSGVKYKRT